jgi:hypothetical protein
MYTKFLTIWISMVILWLIHAITPARVAVVEAQNQSGFPVFGDHGESADRF